MCWQLNVLVDQNDVAVGVDHGHLASKPQTSERCELGYFTDTLTS